ncbi:MAG: hypothetical protein JWL96_1541 [Sphingomonas bacterium]|nr:hypothetical protein [Sphingomonas bacterium]
MRALADLGFIDVKEGQSGPLSYALIKNPYLAIKALREKGHQGVTKEKYNALIERCLEIGETSLNDDVPGELEGVVPDVAAVLTVQPASNQGDALSGAPIVPTPVMPTIWPPIVPPPPSKI